jgi:methionyl-tRNA formyltransferase
MGPAPLPERVRRVVYLGTPAIAVPPLAALLDAGVEVCGVVTGSPRRRGRGAPPTPTPVAAFAEAAELPVGHDLGLLDEVEADLGVVVAFGTVLPAGLVARFPMVNLHFSLLPRWRGAAPVERAILAGDQQTGVCVMQIDEGLDTGGVLASRAVDIGAGETAASLSARLADVGATLLVDTLRQPLPAPVPQSGEPSYAAKISPDDLALDWSLPALSLERRVRVGGAWTTARGRRLRVTAARVVSNPPSGTSASTLAPGELLVGGEVVVGSGAGVLELIEVVPAGRAPQRAIEWVRGWRPGAGERLGGDS